MKTQKLQLFELLNLEAELVGISNTQTGEAILEGLLSQKLSIVIKYWLNDLLSTLSTEKKTLESLRDELIQKYGEEDSDGRIGVKQAIESDEKDKDGNPIMVTNPKYIKFLTEYDSLLQEIKEMKLPSIQLNDLKHIETSDNYPLVFKYLIQLPVEEVEVEEV